MHVDPVTAASTPQTPEQAKLADAAKGFEELLVRQLAQTLVATTQDGDGPGDATSSTAAGLIPDALARAVEDAGGLGLARTISTQLGGGA